MFSLKTVLLPLVALSGLCASAPAEPPNVGTIAAPTPGTAIQPGAAFDFNYVAHGDYGISSLAFHVWLFTGPPASTVAEVFSALAADSADGYYFGRFEYGSSTMPNPPNPPPPQLTMPDFSVSPGGFATGATGSNVPVQLVVIEEWGSFQATLGRQLNVASAAIVYNATTA